MTIASQRKQKELDHGLSHNMITLHIQSCVSYYFNQTKGFMIKKV